MPYRLTTPTIEENFSEDAASWLWLHYRSTAGVSLVKQDGTWSAAYISAFPDLSVLESYYQGGYTHTVSDEVAAELTADGFGSYLEEI